jgi:hypothetical protein
MMLSIRFQRLHSFAVLFVLGLSILSTVTGADIPLTQVGIWNDIDPCAQSCAISASSVFSSLAACPTSDPASCICNVAPAVSAVAGAAHQCASASCASFSSYLADPERARAALTSYCLSNGIVSTGTTVRAKVTTSSSREFLPSKTLSSCINADCVFSKALTSSSTNLAPPSTQFSSTTPQPSSSPSMVTSFSSTSLLVNPTTFPTISSIQAITSSSAPPSASSWISTKAGKAEIGVAVSLGLISILGFVIFLWKIRENFTNGSRDQRAMEGTTMRESKEPVKKETTELEDLALSGRGKEGEQGGESAGRSKDEREPVVRREESQGRSSLNAVGDDARSSLHTQLVHVTTKNGQTCDCYAKLDTGTEGGNFISIIQLGKLGFDKDDLKPSKHTWNALGKHNLPTFGSIKLTWTTNNRTEPEIPVTFYVIDDTFTELVLGKDFAFDKGLIKYYPSAWLGVRNDRPMTNREREELRLRNLAQAQQNVAGRRQWLVDATGRYYYRDAWGRIIYQIQGSGPSGSGSGDPGGQGRNQGGGPSGGSGGLGGQGHS